MQQKKIFINHFIIIDYFGGNAKINEKDIFQITDKIFYSDIKEVKNKFTDLEMTIISQPKKQKKQEKNVKRYRKTVKQYNG